jgi:hypothetical protein
MSETKTISTAREKVELLGIELSDAVGSNVVNLYNHIVPAVTNLLMLNEYYYSNGEDTNYKDICLETVNGNIYVHKIFLTAISCFIENMLQDLDILGNYSEANERGSYGKFPINLKNNSFEAVDIFMRCCYGIDITKQLKASKWKILIEILDIYDFMSPKNIFVAIFEETYEPLIIETIVAQSKIDQKNSDPTVWKILTALNDKNSKIMHTIKLKIIQVNKWHIFRNVFDQSLRLHELEANEYYFISKLSNETKIMIYDYFMDDLSIKFQSKTK